MRSRRLRLSIFKLTTLSLLSVGLAILLSTLPLVQPETHAPRDRSWLTQIGPQPAIAQDQRIRLEEVWQEVYEQVPELPRENQYVSVATGEVASENTLISRIVRYHIYIKGRPSAYRLDWKLTLADYLGVNERISPNTYPGWNTLRTNPLEGDIAAIGQLNRAQRDALVEALVALFSPNATSAPATPQAPAQPTRPSPSPLNPQPGDAQLLLR